MAPSDSALLHIAQSGGHGSDQARRDIVERLTPLLTYQAGRACKANGLDASEVEDVLQITWSTLFDPDTAPFDPSRPGANLEAYLGFLIQNAARKHARFVRNGDEKKHDYAADLNVAKGLPTSIDEIPDDWDGQEAVAARDACSRFMQVVGADDQDLIRRIFFAGQEPKDVAENLGIDRSTVSRRLDRFYQRVKALSPQLVRAGPSSLN